MIIRGLYGVYEARCDDCDHREDVIVDRGGRQTAVDELRRRGWACSKGREACPRHDTGATTR